MGKASELVQKSSQLRAEHRGHGTPMCLAGFSRHQASAEDKQGGEGRPQASGLIPQTSHHQQSQDAPTRESESFMSSWQQAVSTLLGGMG